MAHDANGVRNDVGGALSVRNGTKTYFSANTTGLAAGTFYGTSGWFQDPFLGTWWIACAIKVGSIIRVYYSGSGSGWAETTAATGQFGASRLTVPKHGGYIQFEWAFPQNAGGRNIGVPVDIQNSRPVLLASDGKKTLIMRGFGYIDQGKAVPASPINPPEAARKYPVTAVMHDWLDLANDTVTVSGSNSGAWGTVSRVGMAAPYKWEFNTNATGASSASIISTTSSADAVHTANGSDSVTCPQVILIADYTDRSIWDHIKVDVRVGTAWETVHDPDNDLWGMIEVESNVATEKIIAFGLHDVQASGTSITGIQLTTYVAGAHPLNSKITIYGLATSGFIPGGASYGVARIAPDSLVESPGVVLQMSAQGGDPPSKRAILPPTTNETNERMYNSRTAHSAYDGAGAIKAATVSKSFVFPLDSRLFYSYQVPLVSATLDEIENTFCEGYKIYRKDPGESDWYHVHTEKLGGYNPLPGFEIWGSTNGARTTYTDTLPSAERGFFDRLPDEFNIPPQPFDCIKAANSRLYTAGNAIDASKTRLLMSEQGAPLRFRNLVRIDDTSTPDPASGFSVSLESETPVYLIASGEANSEAAVFLGTNKSVYAVDRVQSSAALFRLNRVGSSGCLAEASVVEFNGSHMWLDTNRSFRSLDQDISRYKVSDRFDDMPEAFSRLVSAAVYKNRLYVAYPYSGATKNTRVLVYNLETGEWESDDRGFPAGDEPQMFLLAQIPGFGEGRLVYFTSSGLIKDYDAPSQTTDSGTAIPFLLETGEFHNNNFDPVVVKNVAVVADKVSTELTTTRTTVEPAGTSIGKLDLNAGSARAWKQDKKPVAGSEPGAESVGIRIKLEGDFTESCKFHAIGAEIEGTNYGGPGV